jgi:hypothetical protein
MDVEGPFFFAAHFVALVRRVFMLRLDESPNLPPGPSCAAAIKLHK